MPNKAARPVSAGPLFFPCATQGLAITIWVTLFWVAS